MTLINTERFTHANKTSDYQFNTTGQVLASADKQELVAGDSTILANDSKLSSIKMYGMTQNEKD